LVLDLIFCICFYFGGIPNTFNSSHFIGTTLQYVCCVGDDSISELVGSTVCLLVTDKNTYICEVNSNCRKLEIWAELSSVLLQNLS